MNKTTVVCFGELLIDMISLEVGDLAKSKGFLKKFGGAPANTAAGLGKLDMPVTFIGKVGDDPFGKFLDTTLTENNVDTSNLIKSKTHKTTLAFVSLQANGERDFSFYRGAHDTIIKAEVTLPKDTFIFHFGSLTQITETTREATDKLIQQAQEQGSTISYDPNVREALWGDLEKARSIILSTAKKVHVLKVNEEEATLLTGESDPKNAAEKLFSPNLDALFITLGQNGVVYKTKSFTRTMRVPIMVNAIDTTGAGDAFNAGFIYGLYKLDKSFSAMNNKELTTLVKRAVIIAALTTTKKGAIEAFPTKKELQAYL